MPLDPTISERAREIAHKHTCRCSGGRGYGPGGDGPRHHSDGCNRLTEEIISLHNEVWEAAAKEAGTYYAQTRNDAFKGFAVLCRSRIIPKD